MDQTTGGGIVGGLQPADNREAFVAVAHEREGEAGEHQPAGRIADGEGQFPLLFKPIVIKETQVQVLAGDRIDEPQGREAIAVDSGAYLRSKQAGQLVVVAQESRAAHRHIPRTANIRPLELGRQARPEQPERGQIRLNQTGEPSPGVAAVHPRADEKLEALEPAAGRVGILGLGRRRPQGHGAGACRRGSKMGGNRQRQFGGKAGGET